MIRFHCLMKNKKIKLKSLFIRKHFIKKEKKFKNTIKFNERRNSIKLHVKYNFR